MNLGDCVIKFALEDAQEDIYEYCKIGLKDNMSIMKIKKAKYEWDVQQKKVIDLLTDLIQYVNVKYEG